MLDSYQFISQLNRAFILDNPIIIQTYACVRCPTNNAFFRRDLSFSISAPISSEIEKR
jgi:hypothetical protein